MKLKTFGIIVVFSFIGFIYYSMQPSSYPPFELENNYIVDKKEHVLIFGATRNTGLEVAKIIINSGGEVTAFVRETSNIEDIKALGANLVLGDALNKDSVEDAFLGQAYSSVVTTIGCYNCDPKPDYLGNKNIFDAAKNAGVKRIILVSTIGAGDSYNATPWPVRRMLKDVLPLKTKAENYLVQNGFEYTIIRPGGLLSKPATMKGYLSQSAETFGVINREDLAILVVRSLDDDRSIGKILAAVDTDLVFPWDMF